MPLNPSSREVRRQCWADRGFAAARPAEELRRICPAVQRDAQRL